MQINSFYKLIFTLYIAFFATLAFAESDPVHLLQQVADKMIAGLKANQANLKNKPQVVYKLAYEYVVPHADIAAMAKRVLPRETWIHASPAQKKQFQTEFTRTLIRTYATALTSYHNQTIRFFPVRGALGQTIEVKSEITSPETQSIQVVYRLIKSGNQWRLYDMSVEGVSMLESFRSQFASILSQGSMGQLLERMARHNQGNQA